MQCYIRALSYLYSVVRGLMAAKGAAESKTTFLMLKDKFCVHCGRLLPVLASATRLNYICEMCREHRPSRPEDTLLYSVEYKANEQVGRLQAFLGSMLDDPASPTVRRDCPRKGCKGEYAKRAYIGDTMEIVFRCTMCGM
jgi:DNA-directed RNA polymerase subunit M/transcription elongation factor TFIIS